MTHDTEALRGLLAKVEAAGLRVVPAVPTTRMRQALGAVTGSWDIGDEAYSQALLAAPSPIPALRALAQGGHHDA